MPQAITGRESVAALGAAADLLRIPAQILTDATTARVAALTDIGWLIAFTSASAKTYTIQAESAMTAPFIAGQPLFVVNDGAGALTLTASGVTLNTALSSLDIAQHKFATLLYRGGNVWTVA